MRNASRYLRECIDSVLSQTFTDFELLIVDDGSTDGSVDIVRSYTDPRIRLICREHDFIASLNTLLDEARGRYIARMDADDVMLPDRLQAQYDYLTGHPEVVAVCSQADRIDQTGTVIGRIGHGDNIIRITPRMMCETNHICNPSTMMRRDIVRASGLRYEREYEFAEDYRFWSRVVSECGPVDCLPKQLLNYRISDTQVTATRWDEMMEATDRVKRALTDRLVSLANPGYHDPVIPESDRQLSLIIPFLNEGEEVERTVKSFLEHGGAGNVDVIVINDCSYDSYPYMEHLAAIPGVSYFLNRERLGVAGSRDKGVGLCRTPYFLLLDAHMRAYDDSWLTTIPTLLRENDRRILCCQTRFLIHNKAGEIITDPDSPPAYGARLTFHNNRPMPGIEWIREENNQDEPYETIPSVLGAGYAASVGYWISIGGLHGLRQYGCDEQMMSLKTWMTGGECILLKNIVLGHIYRTEMPYELATGTILFNNLYISETLFPVKERCKARAIAYLYDREQFGWSFNEILTILHDNPKARPDYSNNAVIFRNIIKINRTATSLDRHLRDDIEAKLHEIAQLLAENPTERPGLFDGALGYALWLFLYSRYCDSHEFESTANDYLSASINRIESNDMTFASGLPGAGWTLGYLMSIGLIDNIDDIMADISGHISAFISTLDVGSYDNGFSRGLAGILAYACMCPALARSTQVGDKLDMAASSILDSHDITVTETFYAFMWLQLRSGTSQYADGSIAFSLNDWNKPSYFIPKDRRFWKLSLYDGVPATSSIIFNS